MRMCGLVHLEENLGGKTCTDVARCGNNNYYLFTTSSKLKTRGVFFAPWTEILVRRNVHPTMMDGEDGPPIDDGADEPVAADPEAAEEPVGPPPLPTIRTPATTAFPQSESLARAGSHVDEVLRTTGRYTPRSTTPSPPSTREPVVDGASG